MKKVIIGMCLISSIFLTGCNGNSKKVEELDKLGKEYYEQYMSGILNVSEFEITLKAIRKVADKNDYKIDELKNCKDETKVTYIVKDGKIDDKKFDIICD